MCPREVARVLLAGRKIAEQNRRSNSIRSAGVGAQRAAFASFAFGWCFVIENGYMIRYEYGRSGAMVSNICPVAMLNEKKSVAFQAVHARLKDILRSDAKFSPMV